MRLLLVRHGESVCAVGGIVGGAIGCTGLTERGLDQARALRDRLEFEGFRADALYASTLPRARQTADTIAPALGLDVRVDAELCEFIPGEIDGTRWEDFEGFDVVAFPERPLSAGGESLVVFRKRVRSLLDRLAGEHAGETVVAVCHGGVVWSSLYQLFGMAEGTISADVDYTSITEWRKDDRWHLVRFNDVAHLMSSNLLVS